MKILFKAFFIVLAVYMPAAFAAIPILTITKGTQKIQYTSAQLLSRPDVTTLTITNDPTFPGKMNYQAVPATALFKDIKIPSDAAIAFQTLDGFSAPIAQEHLLNTTSNAAIAYIAIERPTDKWPTVKSGNAQHSAGPFYLIWLNPEKSKIGREEWVYQLSGFEINESFAKQFPHVYPGADVAANDPIMLGFNVFAKNCFSCHTLNREGKAQMGPDLNVPYSPTEYFSPTNLKKFIRNPQDLRYWPQAKMKGFSAELISDQELNDLIAYLTYMAARKSSS